MIARFLDEPLQGRRRGNLAHRRLGLTLPVLPDTRGGRFEKFVAEGSP